MKTAFVFLLAVSLFGVAYFIGGFFFDAGAFIAGGFVACLLAWTIVQYGGKSRGFVVARPIRLAVRTRGPDGPAKIHRIAA